MEAQLITRILKEKDIGSALNKGISVDHFTTRKSKIWFLALFAYFQKYHSIPDASRFQKICTDFVPIDEPGTVEDWSDQVIGHAIEINVIRSCKEIIKRVEDGGESLDTFFMESARKIARLAVTQGSSDLKDDMWRRIEEYKNETDGGFWKLNYGMPTIDRLTDGIHKGELIILGGKPGAGKSNFGRFMLGSFFKQDAKVLAFSFEEPRRKYMRRLDSMLHGISYDAIKTHTLNEDQINTWERASTLIEQAKGNIKVIGGQMNMSLMDVIGGIERYKPDVVLIDGVYMMRLDKNTRVSLDWGTVGQAFIEIRALSLGYDIPIIGITHLTRNSDEMDPQMEDLAFTEQAGRVADVVMLMGGQKTSSQRYITIGKNRDGECPANRITVAVDFDLVSFKEMKIEEMKPNENTGKKVFVGPFAPPDVMFEEAMRKLDPSRP